MNKVTIQDVRRFWEENPLAASAIKAELGTPEFYACFDKLREKVEPPPFQASFYRYEQYHGARVLDVGCGNGYILSRYARQGAWTVGIDLTQRAVWLSSQRFGQEQLPGYFSQANAEELPFDDSSFDLVTAVGVLHHTPRTEIAVREIYRVLKRGGTFLIMLYHQNSLLYQVTFRLWRRFSRSACGKSQAEMANRVDGESNPLGKVYSKADMLSLLAPFESVEVQAACLKAKHFPKYALARLIPTFILDYLGRWVGWFLYARAVK